MKIFKAIGDFFGKIGTFFREVRAELSKVVWPSWDDVKRYTKAVLFSMVGVGLVLWGTDALLTLLMSLIIKK
ncbi:MAG TPA: preprotein translocase subunit SecE [Bacillota bacterium]|jgi:preprotein translocase subunit SecE|nr:preprotein translocase subunit SecE [Candidatus Fermentithermobacillaceae bacterium]HOB30454.1 preprotein translocase subunit SecE [Bacillota bacterium]HOK64297.1 preprotein translocase subunit SecE [Bacillota bacterium]HOL12668.1 preprotein translocase subunit SecE [Bacillota bacterium]HOQ03063.1 preprotein translocase subunit SecE [Bacillota bacterium]